MKYFLLFVLFINTLVFAEPQFLMPEEAFKPSAAITKKGEIAAKIELGNHIYLYKSKLHAKILGKSGIAIDHITLPEGVDHEGQTVFTKSPNISIALKASKRVSGLVPITLQLEFQGCSEDGLCYEPIVQKIPLKIDSAQFIATEEKVPNIVKAEPVVVPSVVKSELNVSKPMVRKRSPIVVSETDQITQTFIEGNVPLILLTFFTFGLLLSLTPCIFPMIPILSSIIVAQGKNMNAKRGFILSLVYVLAMSVAYTIAGVLAGLFGGNIQIAMQNPWVISTFALLFVGLAMSMFGFFKIGLPHSWQTKLSKSSENASSKGGYIGVAIMGFFSALIVGPCVAPPLAGALVYIGQSGDALLGGAALFVLSIGMGIPLLLIGIGAGKYMPHPGGWMDTVSHIFGVVMIAIAILMLSRIVTASIALLLWSFLLIIVSVYLGALESLNGHHKGLKAFYKGVGIILLVYGLMMFYGGVKGGENPLSPLTFANEQQTVAAKKIEFKTIHSSEELDTILAQSKGKKVMLDFYADWCTSCKELDAVTFKDPTVIEALKNYVLVRADITDNSEEEKALTKRFGLFGPPAMIFFCEKGVQIKGGDLNGYKDTQAFITHIKSLEK
ncbi:MAG: protein-disulfide reductase DsbD [Campylobacterales bacterium]|nr:protein-disulfide reductase DsbD [Campylobacterales bacterium]